MSNLKSLINELIVGGVSRPGDDVAKSAEIDVLSSRPQVKNPCNGFRPPRAGVPIWNAPSA